MRLRSHPSRRARPRRRATALGLALLVAAGSLALAPTAGADDEGGEPDLSEEPFGQQIEPGTNLQDTAIVETGTYVLPIPEVGADHYFEIERTEPGQVIWYGVTAILPEPAPEDASLVVLGTAAGDETLECNSTVTGSGDPVSHVTRLFNGNRSSDCRSAESITLQVENRPLFDSDPLPTDTSYQLTVWTEPGLDDRAGLPGANEASPWVEVDYQGEEPQPVEGARSFAEAQPLESGGLYEVSLRRGEPQIFAFPLTYGQHAQALAQIVEGGDVFNDLTPTWITPLGGQIRPVIPAGGPDPGLSLDGEDGPAGWSTPIVGYLNRERTGTVGSTGGTGGAFGGAAAAPAAFAGTYFLLLELPESTEFSEYPEEATIRMGVETVDDYEGSVPDYAEEPAPLSALDGSGFVETDEQQQASREQAAEPAPWLLVGGLFAGAALLAVIGGVAVGRALRRSA